MFIIARPLLVNVPKGGPGWRRVTCGVCGTPCWERPDQEAAARLICPDATAACTMCALAGRSPEEGQ